MKDILIKGTMLTFMSFAIVACGGGGGGGSVQTVPDTPPVETPTETPTETPAETPVEVPVETPVTPEPTPAPIEEPVETPVEEPVETPAPVEPTPEPVMPEPVEPTPAPAPVQPAPAPITISSVTATDITLSDGTTLSGLVADGEYSKQDIIDNYPVLDGAFEILPGDFIVTTVARGTPDPINASIYRQQMDTYLRSESDAALIIRNLMVSYRWTGITATQLRSIPGVTNAEVNALLVAIDGDGNNVITRGEIDNYRNLLNAGINRTSDRNRYYSTLNVDGLQSAHDAGWTGRGVNVLVVDNGLHGVETSGTAAAVAPGANTKWISHNGTYVMNVGSNFTTAASNIVNHSYGWFYNADSRYGNASLAEATRASAANMNLWANRAGNALHVYATANNVNHQCAASTLAACDGNVNAIASGNVNGVNILVGDYEYSDPIGNTSAKNHYLVADGTGIAGSQGSSYAAPKVAGAAALVKHKFQTDAAQTKYIILNTATDIGAAGVDNVYGHGKLNVGAALSPVGNLR